MVIAIHPNLIVLAEACAKLNGHLYVVGGFVRDALLNNKSGDVDICSQLSVECMSELAQQLGFFCTTINKKLGTLKLKKDNVSFEYTTFRKEEYDNDGTHTPARVLFVDSVVADSVRRDFTINAIYYDILSKEIIDPCNGLDDLKNRLLKTTTAPDITFTEDALRILRLIRFAHRLDFKIDKKTAAAAFSNRTKLARISSHRIIDELTQIIGYNKNHSTYIDLINKFDILNVALRFNKSVDVNFSICKKSTYYKNYINHSQNSLLTFLALVFLSSFNLVKTENVLEKLHTVINKNFFIDNKTSSALVQFFTFYQKIRELKKLAVSKNISEKSKSTEIAFSKKSAETDNFANCTLSDINKVHNSLNISDLIYFENMSDAAKDLVKLFFNNCYNTLLKTVLKLKKNNFPFKLDDLQITNSQLLNVPIDNKKITETKKTILSLCQNNELENDNKKILDYLQAARTSNT